MGIDRYVPYGIRKHIGEYVDVRVYRYDECFAIYRHYEMEIDLAHTTQELGIILVPGMYSAVVFVIDPGWCPGDFFYCYRVFHNQLYIHIYGGGVRAIRK